MAYTLGDTNNDIGTLQKSLSTAGLLKGNYTSGTLDQPTWDAFHQFNASSSAGAQFLDAKGNVTQDLTNSKSFNFGPNTQGYLDALTRNAPAVSPDQQTTNEQTLATNSKTYSSATPTPTQPFSGYPQNGEGNQSGANYPAGFKVAQASGDAPQDPSTGKAAVQQHTPVSAPTTTPNVDSFFNNNESIDQQTKDLQEFLSPQATTDTLNQEVAKITTDNTILSGLNTQLMDINKVMSGTEDDIRKEIQASGGFATNSQVIALSAARNKTLLQQANNLKTQIATQENLVKSDTTLYTNDKSLALQQYNERSGILKMLEANQKSIDTAARSSYNLIVKNMGYAGLYASLQSDPNAVASAEKALGLQPGQLQEFATNNPNTGTISTYQTDENGNQFKVTTKNGQPVSNIEQKPTTPKDESVTTYQNIDGKTYKVTTKGGVETSRVEQKGKNATQSKTQQLTEDTNKLDGYIQKNIGKDGYVSPQTYKSARNAWIQDGYSAGAFDSKFGKFANPVDPQDYRGGV